MIGHKRIIFAIDTADETRAPIRTVTINFFKTYLGFTDEEIIFVDRMEFIGANPNYITKFSAQTTNRMDEFARSIF